MKTGSIEIAVPLPRRGYLRRPVRQHALASGLSGTLTVAVVSLCALFAASPASAQWMCTGITDITCTNSGTANGNTVVAPNNAIVTNSGTDTGGIFTSAGNNATVTNSGTETIGIFTSANNNATVTNSGSNAGGIFTSAGNNATVTNSGSNAGGIFTSAGNNATVTNSGSNAGSITTFGGGSATVTNSGSNTGGIFTSANNNATVINSGSNAGGIFTNTDVDATVINSGSTGGIIANAGGNATVTNSGSTGGITASANGNVAVTNSGSSGGIFTSAVGNITVTNSGSNTGSGITALATGNTTVTNSGSNTGGIFTQAGGNATVINSGITDVIVVTALGNATLTNVVGGRVVGPIQLESSNNIINFQGGNWLFSIGAGGATTTINTVGAPFVVSGSSGTGFQIAVLDATTFALADRSLMNFTGEIAEMLQGRFDGMGSGAGGGGALGFAGAPSSPVADSAQAAFSGIPSVAMSYASGGSRPVLGKAPAAVPYYDTTIWASGFGGERHQRADGLVLPTDDTAFGGAMGVDRVFGGNLRLGAFVGAGAGREQVELDVQKIDATYVFGGAYGRFDWVASYLDFALYGGGIDNKSTRQVANNTVANGLEIATASYGGWFISPELTYGYRIPFNAITVTPRARLRYVGGELDGYSESGSMQNLSVGRRSLNDLEERGEVELSTVSGGFKGTAYVGVIGLERLGNPTINTVLLSQSLSFTTPGQASAVGGVVGAGLQYRPLPNVKLFVSGEGIAMSDKSDSWAATGGAQVAF